ncbi:NAD+ synthase [Acidiferrobacter sp.]|jgi:NAD+ synthase (glutamine-hydrolysing)|uniref:NAD+ synthase n=1 Tax=Acidiferrobacter sp. TaxID=1872107 RepID=UPI0026224DF2|nr:NAD+ synthase [Acidiferrobacter sp.]
MVTVALCQMRCAVGDIAGNARRMAAFARTARNRHGADLIAFPELAITGYPPEDLLLRADFVRRARAAVEGLAAQCPDIDMLVGLPWAEDGRLYNAVAWVHAGMIADLYRKQILPNYGVFDERRYFATGDAPLVRVVGGNAIGVTICEDLWEPGPVAHAVAAGAGIVINVNASPYHRDKDRLRLQVAGARVAQDGVTLAYVNMVGGQDELVFDGMSFVIDRLGEVVARAAAFDEELAIVRFDGAGAVLAGPKATWPTGEQALYEALKLGLADYVERNGFKTVVLGLSGGIDSAVTLALCRDALPHVALRAVMMPSEYTQAMSIEDARSEAAALGLALAVVPIDPAYEVLAATLDGLWDGPGRGLAAENLQARIRGTLLMTIANAHRGLVVVTSNKSELAVGYTTLYGDMAGGYAPLKDVFKTDVYALARYRNGLGAIIPQRVLTRAPSAELRLDQKDSDSLPPYDVLDAVLARYIEQDWDADALIAAGFDASLIAEILRLVRGAEHKRKQAPIGTRVTARAFGRDWRYPVTASYEPPRM